LNARFAPLSPAAKNILSDAMLSDDPRPLNEANEQ
jgi:hypothetical protein